MSKIHRVTVTHADLNYIGSITVDQDLLDASGIRPYQMVNVNSVANGTFWQTYVVPGEKGSGIISLNGPPAHHFKPGDIAIIVAEAYLEPKELPDLKPVVVFVDAKNKITEVKTHDQVYNVIK